MSRYLSVQEEALSETDEEFQWILAQFEGFKKSFAQTLVQERQNLTFADAVSLCQPLAAEEVIHEPIIWTVFANLALSENIEKMRYEDVVQLAWSIGKVQNDLPELENGENFKHQGDFWKMVVEKRMAMEMREMREDKYASEKCLPMLSTMCLILTQEVAEARGGDLISERFWVQLSQAILMSLQAVQINKLSVENDILDTIMHTVQANKKLDQKILDEMVKIAQKK